MTERLTRSHRRHIENKTHQKINLDHLSQINVDQLVQDINESDDSSCSEEEALSDESSELSSDEQVSSDEDGDLDELLNKAQAALAKESNIQLSKPKVISTKLSQMNVGIAVDQALYFKTHGGRSKLVTEAIELLEPGESASKKATVVLKASNDVKKLNKKERQLEREKTTGKAWFDMPKAIMTDEIKRDLQVLKMRHILDRKRHYKKMGNRPDPKYFQIGTLIESPTEFFSARINKKERKQTIVDELMANDDQKQYYKRKYDQVQERTQSGGKKHFKKLKAQRQWAK